MSGHNFLGVNDAVSTGYVKIRVHRSRALIAFGVCLSA